MTTTKEIYIDEPDKEVRIYFDTVNCKRIHELAYKWLDTDEYTTFRKLLDKLSSESVILYADISGYFDFEDDDGCYEDGYEARVEEEETERENFKYRHGHLLQHLNQIFYKFGGRKDEPLSDEELKEIIEILEGETL